MYNEPLISIIVPTFNRAHLLPRAINSILNQTYDDFEIIIVNDGSTDNTEEVVNSFDDSRIIYHHNEINKGVLNTKNTGFDLARGRYITKLDDDDELLPNALYEAMKEFEIASKDGVKLLWFNCIDAEIEKISGKSPDKECNIHYNDLLCGTIAGDHWIVLARDLLEDNRFDEKLWANEGQLWLKLHRKSKGRYIPKILYKAYRCHGERICTESPLKHLHRKIYTHQEYLKLFGADLKQMCPKKYGSKLSALGLLQILNAEKKESRINICESLKYNFSIKYLILYLAECVLSTNQIKKIYLLYTKNV